MELREIQLDSRCYRCGKTFHGTDEELDTWAIYYSGNGVDKITPAAIYCPGCITTAEHVELEVRDAIGDNLN